MKTKMSKATQNHAEHIKNCVEGLLVKYKDFKAKHPEKTFEDAVITRLQNNYDVLSKLLPTTTTTIIKPCSILELERMVQYLISEFYDKVEKEFKNIQIEKFTKQKQFDNIVTSCELVIKLVQAFDEIDQTINWHFENIKA